MNPMKNTTEKKANIGEVVINIIALIIILILSMYFGFEMGKQTMINDICNVHEYPFCSSNQPKPRKTYTYEPKRIITEDEVQRWME